MSEDKQFALPNSGDCEKISKVIGDISDTMAKIEAMNEYIKEAKAGLKEKYELPPKQITLMIKLFHSDTAEDYFSDTQVAEEFYDKMFA